MKYIDLTLKKPEENLALDEALLDCCEEGLCQDEILRFWEPALYFVVLGYSQKTKLETRFDTCKKANIPILRRPSGGGAVLQGPGCLNFTLILSIKKRPTLKNLVETNRYVLGYNQKAIQALVSETVEISGTSDLSLKSLKFSGNAQRRKREYILFHGTFLLHFDLTLIEQTLPMPSKRPDYRKNRTHLEFLTNLNLSPSTVKQGLQTVWRANQPLTKIPHEQIKFLTKERYENKTWNFKF